jgi:predicted amidophosphoribosyltransferase
MSFQYTHRPGGSAHCPECQEPISRLANICPHCRTDLTANEAWQAQKANRSAGCASLVIIGLGCAGIVGVTVVGLIG